MRVGVPKEIKLDEYRVGLTPASVREYVSRGHGVMVERGAGLGIGASDDTYRSAGAAIVDTASEIFVTADMVVKVKEPQATEWRQLREGQILFTYLHLAPDSDQAKGLLASGCTAIAYETVTDANGGLPLLAPMSEVAGRLAIEAAAAALRKSADGMGKLIGGVPGVAPARIAVIGGGVVGTHAARMAAGLGADIVILDRSLPRLRLLDELFAGRVRTRYATLEAIDSRADRCGCRHRGGAGPRRERAEAGPSRAFVPHEASRGAGRRRDRSGRLFRDVEADDPSGADLSGRRGRALLRRQHAGRRAGYVEPRAQ